LPTPAKKWPARLGLILLVTLLSVLAGELVLRVLELPAARGPVAWKASWAPLNSLGYRGPEPAVPKVRPRLLLLGDSQVEAVSTHDYAAAPGPQLQRHLGARGHAWEVVGLAAAGWGTDQQLIALQHHFDRLRPDAVVLFSTLENDLIDNLFCTGTGGPKPTYRLDKGGRLVPPTPSWVRPGERPAFGLLPMLRRAFGPVPPTDRDWDSTMPGPLLTPPTTRGGPSLIDFLRQLYGFAPRRIRLADLANCRVSWCVFYNPTPWRVVHALALHQALLAAMRDFCAARGVPFFVFKQRDPSMQRRWEGKVLTLEGRKLGFSPSEVERMYRETFERLKVPFLDLHLDHRKHTLLPKDPHLNEQGCAVLARRVGAWLLDQRTFLAKSKKTANMSPRR